VFCLALNAVVSALLVWPMKEAGLALANTLTSMVNVTLLAHALRRKLARLEWQTLRRHFPAMLGAAVCAGALAWWLANLWGRRWGHDTLPLRLGEVFLPMLAGTLVYFGLNWWLKVPFLQECLAQLPGRRRSGS
jgi:putative peptidoglycan lipid II flippase